MNKKLAAISVATATFASLMVASPANAALEGPDRNITYGSQYGSVQRAKLAEHSDGSGNYVMVYGSGACTTSTTTPDISVSSLPSDWNDEISNVKDYNYCDVNLAIDINFGNSVGYRNFTPTGAYVGDSLNDEVSSFRVS